MIKSFRFFIVIGCLLLLVAVILKGIMFSDPTMFRIVKPGSLLILANTSFILAVLFKK